jgi:hypothetical protein
MARFLRCVGADNNAYYINVDQVGWFVRPHGATHTVIRFSGTPDSVTVRETPHQIMTHAGGHGGDRGEHEEHEPRHAVR